MTDSKPAPENESPVEEIIFPEEKTTESRASRIFSRISITYLILVILSLVFLWQWFSGHEVVNEMRQQVAAKISEMENLSKANQRLLRQSNEQVQALLTKVTALESAYADLKGQRAALDALYNELSASRDETALAEVEQLLLIAAQQLQLSRNIKAALIAMQSADARLQRMGQRALSGLRKTIAQEMGKLRALPNVDVRKMNFQLDALIHLVDKVPLRYQRHQSEQAETTIVGPSEGDTVWQRLWWEIKQDFSKLVHVEDIGSAETALLSPSEEYFLRENLRLRLMSVRLGLLSRDEVSFKRELSTARQWAERYFDGKSAEGVRFIGSLDVLGKSTINMETPDVGISLQAVRNYRLSHDAVQ
jgi:uroporphyrin-3 C-methyltransferase